MLYISFPAICNFFKLYLLLTAKVCIILLFKFISSNKLLLSKFIWIIIEFKNSKPKVSEKINLDKIRKMCFRKNKFNAYKLNYLMFKNIDNVYINNKKLSSYEQLSLLRIYLFDIINKSKPYFD